VRVGWGNLNRMDTRLVVFGPGYCGSAVLHAARARLWRAEGVPRGADAATVRALLADATHVLSTVPPDDDGDPILQRYDAALNAAPGLRWLGYLSTTGVYGDRGGDWVDEATEPAPMSPRAARRVEAEQSWARLAQRCAVDLFRLGGIYGPGRSAFDDLRSGRARRVVKPGHAFGRIHRDDVVQAVIAAMDQDAEPGVRVCNLVDDEPAESAAVVEEAARLLRVSPPPPVAFADAFATMSPIARSFWAENRKVSSRATQRALGIAWRYPSYREGLQAILVEERAQGGAQQD
jgi:nucleoside-diphosphate-sugar epimerase